METHCDVWCVMCDAWWTAQEEKAEEERKRRQEMEQDYLAPFLAQIGDPDRIQKKEAFQLRESALHVSLPFSFSFSAHLL